MVVSCHVDAGVMLMKTVFCLFPLDSALLQQPAAVLEQEVPTLAENLLEQEQVGGPPQRPLVVELG